MEAYLDTVLAPLARRLSPFQVGELRRELRAHLWSRIDAYAELGQSEDDAVSEALAQFGGADGFLKQWRHEWARPTLRERLRVTPREIWEAMRPMLRPTLTGIAAAFVPFVFLQWRCYGLHGSPSPALTVGAWAWFCYAFLLLPAGIGISQGRRAPGCAGLGMAAVLTTEIAAASLLFEFGTWLFPTGSPEGPATDGLFSALLSLLCAWVPSAAGAAALSGWWARRGETRRVA